MSREHQQARSTATRNSLLNAAAELVRTHGAREFTLEAVADAAGVSKGGLLYHYPSKAALLEAMVDAWCVGFDDSCLVAEPGRQPGAATAAFVDATFETGADQSTLGANLLAAALVDPALLDPWRDRMRQWQQRLTDDGIDPAVATVARLAADGLWVADALDFAPPRGAFREQVRAALDRLVEEARS